jgi:hypothetical protein
MVRFRAILCIFLLCGGAAFAADVRTDFATETSPSASPADLTAGGQAQSRGRTETSETANETLNQAALIAAALEKIANSIATPPDPVSRRFVHGFFWYLYPWQTFVAAGLAFAAVWFQIRKQERWRTADTERENKARADAARRQKWAFLKALENQTLISKRELENCRVYLKNLSFEDLLSGGTKYPGRVRLSWIRLTAPELINDWERLAELPLEAAAAAFQFQASVVKIMALVGVFENAGAAGLTIEFDLIPKMLKEFDTATRDASRLLGRIQIAKIGLEPGDVEY